MAVEVVIAPGKLEARPVRADNTQIHPGLLERAIQLVLVTKPDAQAHHPLLKHLLNNVIPQSFMPDRSQYSGTIE